MNEIVISTADMPAYLRNVEAEVDDLITTEDFLPRISIRGRRFRLVQDGEETPAVAEGQPLPVIILAADPPGRGHGKVYYEGSYNPGSSDPPDCYSRDGINPDGGEAPMPGPCAGCEMNTWGSGVKSDGSPSKGKACNDVKTLIVTPANNPNVQAYTLQVPPTSLKALSQYGAKLKEHKVPMQAVITLVTFADSEFSKLVFGYGGFLSEEAGQAALTRAASDEIQNRLHRGDVPKAPKPLPEPLKEPEKPVDTSWGSTEQAEASSEPPAQPPKREPKGTPVPTDSRGVAYSPDHHAMGRDKCPVFNKDGSFRRKKGVPDAVLAEYESQFLDEPVSNNPPADSKPETTEPKVEDIFREWGA